MSKNKKILYGNMNCQTHVEEGVPFTVAPLDGLPFIPSFASEVAKQKLHPSEKFVLQQLELFTVPSNLRRTSSTSSLVTMAAAKDGSGAGFVGMRCRNCIADIKNGCCFMKVSSVASIAQDVMLMASEHIVSCRFMKVKDVKVVQECLKRHGAGAGDGEETGGNSWLGDYCKHVARLYSLESSSKGTGGGGVIWGQSPKVPAGEYCAPSDVDVGLLLEQPTIVT